MIPIFDGHNDTLLSLESTGRSFFERSEQGHLDLPRARAGGLAGGFFAVWIPDPASMPPPMSLDHARRAAIAQAARLFRIEREGEGAVKIVRAVSELRDCLADGTFAMILHFEGAEPIDDDLDALEVFHRAGLRSLGLVWSRSNRFAHGVPFQFPGSPDTGPGLTDVGKELVRACNRLRIMVDLSHLNEQGFWDVAKLSDAPLAATHSNAHALSPSTRNLTDRQLDAIRESGGIVGVNFNVGFLRADGARIIETPLEIVADHVDYLVQRLGIDKVALGSDFDGATMPADLSDVTKLPNLLAVLRARGYDDRTLRLIGCENWLRVLDQTWGMERHGMPGPYAGPICRAHPHRPRAN